MNTFFSTDLTIFIERYLERHDMELIDADRYSIVTTYMVYSYIKFEMLYDVEIK